MAERSRVGRRIETACAMRGMKMGTLADTIGVSRNALSSIVTGKTEDPSSGIVVRIAETLEVSTDFLLGLSDTIEMDLQPAALALV